MTVPNDDAFQYWLTDMDDALRRFYAVLPADVRICLDSSPESLAALESWLLVKYPSVDAAKAKFEATTVDGAARYVGQTFRKELGGLWSIDFTDTTNAFFGLPQLKGLRGQRSQLCPLTLVTTSIDRRLGTFLQGILETQMRRAQ